MSDDVLLTAAAEDAEFYPTPAWAVRRLLEREDCWFLRGGIRWFDPCVGDGAIVDAVTDLIGVRRWSALDIRSTAWTRSQAIQPRCYLTDGFPSHIDVCVMNPPFSKALAFAKMAVSHCTHTFMLQRRHWLTAALRQDREWITAHKPAEFLFPDRIQFVNGASDSQEYEWYCWSPAVSGLHFLANTPLEERRLSPRVNPAQQRLALEAPK